MRLRILFSVICSLLSGPFTLVFAQSYYHDDPQDIVLKKALIKAFYQEISPDYLLTIENELWNKPQFYQNVVPFPHIADVIRESSGFKGMNHPVVFDGDKIERYTGRKISDIPGSAIMVYDGRTTMNRTLNYREYEVIDGDQIWVERGTPFETIPEGYIVVYDCLFPPVLNCGKKEARRAVPFPQRLFGVPEDRDTVDYWGNVEETSQNYENMGDALKRLPWPITGGMILLFFVGLHFLIQRLADSENQ